jgi:hypothetical protein
MVAHIIKGYPFAASDKYLQIELIIVNKELEAYFRHISKQGDRWGLVRPARTSLTEYMDQFFMQGIVAQSSIERRFPDFWEGLKSLQSAVTAPASASASSSSRLSSTASRSDTLFSEA